MDSSHRASTDSVAVPNRQDAARSLPVLVGLAAIVMTALVGALSAVIVTELLDRGRWEQAVIGLTEESTWPMHDVHLATAAGQLDDPALVEGVLAERGLSEDVVVRLDRQRQSGNGTLTISAQATSATTAADVANAVAEQVVATAPEGTPIRLVDRANASPEASTAAVALSGGFVGLLIGIVLWTPADLSSRLRRRFDL